MKKIFFFLSMLVDGICTFGQDATVQTPAAYTTTLNNYIRTWMAVKPDTAATNYITGVSLSHSRLTTQYFDGLGRPVETVAKKGSLRTGDTAVDMVQAQVYDYLGREPRKYLPFAASNYGSNSSISDGGFKLNPFQEQQNFYSDNNANSPIKGQGETYYYSKQEIESSPLNRVNKSFAPGDNWVHNGKGLKMNYQVNTAIDSVRVWKVTNSGTTGVFASYSCDSLYYPGELFKNVTTDESNEEIIEFKDREGKVVLKKVQNTAAADTGTGKGHTGWYCTYYVYDDNNLLRCVIQPRGVELLLANSWNITWNSSVILNEQCFRYEYDGKRRLQMKKVPGAVEAYMVYDQWDRLVLNQDANLRGLNQWLFTKYDSLNRPIITGMYTDATHTSLSSMQGYLNSLNMGRSEIFNNAYYPEYSLTNSFPSVSSSNVLTYTYYDNYSWAGWYGSYANKDNNFDSYFSTPSNTTFPYPQSLTQSTYTKGLVTGVWQATGGLLTANYYDDLRRIIQTKYYNITGGVDVTTTQYSFTGQPLMVVSSTVKTGTNAQTTTVLTQLSYDSLMRPVQVQKKIANSLVNGGAIPSGWTTTVQNKYDALGHLGQKNLGNKPGSPLGTPLTNQVYVYNIRDWLLSINKSYVDTTINSDQYFGMELGYDKNASLGTFAPQYNGNIAGTIWKAEGDQAKRKYDFTYDVTSRLTGANFNQYVSGSGTTATFNQSAGIDYTVSNLSYDANGNILALRQKGWKLNSSPTIDSLTYSYLSNSNKLAKVTDGITDTAVRLGDFRDGTNAGDDYSYDTNGNLNLDNNKKIDVIKYNYLNLPDTIHVVGKGNVFFWYDVLGNKLKKVTVDSTLSPVRQTTTLYLGGQVFLNDTLSLLSHEEGRARLNSAGNGFVYDYFMKDHLGNTRVVLTEEAQTDAYPNAGLEDSTIATERLYYANLDSGRVNKSTVPGYPNDTYTSPNNYIQQLSGSAGAHILGSNIVIKVMAGDTINIRANSWYRQNGTSPGTPTGPLASLIIGLAGGVAGTDPGHFILSPLQQAGVLDPGINSFLSTVSSDYASHSSKPKAYLNWVLFDEQLHYVAGTGTTNSGFRQVGADTTFTTHNITGQVMTRSGWLFVYVSNETPNINVFFDNLQLTHIRGRIVEETHYYPFGLSMTGISYQEAGKPENKYRYNGKELQHKEWSDASGLEWYEYGARMYDVQIGRWTSPDPLSEKYDSRSIYHYANNNPIKYLDPNGKEIVNGSKKGTPEYDRTQNALTILQKTNPSAYKALQESSTKFVISTGKLNPDARYEKNYSGAFKNGNTSPELSYPKSFSVNKLTNEKGEVTGGQISGQYLGEERDKLVDKGIDPKGMKKLYTEEEANKYVKLKGDVDITIDASIKDQEKFTIVLGHEFGHAEYDLENPAGALIWGNIGDPESQGHDKNNPSGIKADEEEANTSRDYQNALQQIFLDAIKHKLFF